MNRLVLSTIVVAFLVVPLTSLRMAHAEKVTVYKTPTCGCCSGWVGYLRDNGFEVVTHDLNSLTGIKAQHGLTDSRLMS